MEIITYSCHSISPMFIGNANPKDAELRPVVIKASLRFWWRALHPNLSLIELKTKIDTTDKEIDSMVYELYGLSEEEIEIVEGLN